MCENIKSFAVTPVKVEGEIIGVLVTASRRPGYFHSRFNDVIYIIGNQIGMAIRISQLYEEIFGFNQALEKKVAERTRELEEKTARLVAAERLATLGMMSRRIAHEFRNSLTVVGGFARRLDEKTDPEDPRRKYVEVIVDEVKVLEKKVAEIIGEGAP
ncbi:MAG: hypothetical protein DRH56_08545 [Deltaproteobacteria bacterium]|nr:MAG: hypothetical protein DRH56_08545 [Deltaproteobacteria bacterium]